MKSIVPYTKEIKFDNKIAEICSISLEHELSVKNKELEGSFIISGEYRSHEVSVNKEPFQYKLPFSVDMTDNINTDSVEFEITDFTYDVLREDTLKVDIEFSVTAEEKIKEIELEPSETQVEKEEVREAVIEEINQMFNEEQEDIEQTENEEEKRLEKESEELILADANSKEDEFATYHIHIVKENDSVESICSLYGTDSTTLKNYNQIENLEIGDKIIIPCLDE